MITEKERQELAGEISAFIYNFFRFREPQATVQGNRRAADKAAAVTGRVVAAVMHEGSLNGEYLVYSRWLERRLSEELRGAVDSVIVSDIKAVD